MDDEATEQHKNMTTDAAIWIPVLMIFNVSIILCIEDQDNADTAWTYFQCMHVCCFWNNHKNVYFNNEFIAFFMYIYSSGMWHIFEDMILYNYVT